jgi:hypothetical protein
MAKKAVLFLSAFLLFFYFGSVKAQDMSDVEIPVPTLYDESSTGTNMLISPISESATSTTKILKLQKQDDFLEVCSLSKCRIPIPTLREPNNKNFGLNQKIYLTGLTWNNTTIDVYIDSTYAGSAIVRNDEKSNTANFYFEFENNLSAGKHNWSVIARSLNERDRSYLSVRNSFTVLSNSGFEISNTQTTSTSSISENREMLDIVSQELDVPVSVSSSTSDAGVNVTSSEEKNILVVDNSLKSDSATSSQITENIQSATPSEEMKEQIQKDLQVNDSEKNKKKIGIILLSVLVVFSAISVVFFRKKK